MHSLAKVQTSQFPSTLQGECAYTPHAHARASPIYVMIYVYTCCKSAVHSRIMLSVASSMGNVRRKFLSLMECSYTLNEYKLIFKIYNRWNISHVSIKIYLKSIDI